ENDWVRGFDIEFSRVGVLKIAGVARKLDAGRLHAETNSEVRSARAPRVRDRANHSLDAALAKPAGNQDRVKVTQAGFGVIVHQLFRFDPTNIDAQIVGDSA